MTLKTIHACAIVVAFGFAAYTASTTTASAARAIVASKTHHIGKSGLSLRANGGRTRCLEAECGQPPVPIDDTYVVRGCQATPAGQPLPPWCEGATGVPRRATRGFRR